MVFIASETVQSRNCNSASRHSSILERRESQNKIKTNASGLRLPR
jgi:hypothetical protein